MRQIKQGDSEKFYTVVDTLSNFAKSIFGSISNMTNELETVSRIDKPEIVAKKKRVKKIVKKQEVKTPATN